MSKMSALVVLYEGEPLSDYIVGHIMQEICTTAQRSAESIVVHSLNPTEVAQALCKVVEKEPAVVNSPELDPMEAALTYIGERFSPQDKDEIEFITQLCAAANAEPHNVELENAMAIIAEKPFNVARNQKTARKYGLTGIQRKYIAQVYQQLYVPRDTEKIKVTIK